MAILQFQKNTGYCIHSKSRGCVLADTGSVVYMGPNDCLENLSYLQQHSRLRPSNKRNSVLLH